MTRELIAAYADVVGDHNPLHTDVEYATLVARIRKVVVEGKAYVGSTLVLTTTIEALCEA